MKPSPLALRQSQGLRQELQLLPQLLQSLELLTLPAMELTEWLERQAEGNEALEVRRAQPATDHDWWQDEPARATTLAEHIEAELALCELEPAVLRTIRWLALRLDARGWLCEPEEELHAEAVREGLLREDESLVLRKALHQLQQLEPRGLGARDLAEALLLQLDPRAADYALLTRLIEFHLADLAARRLHVVARKLEVEHQRLEQLCGQLRRLDPFPGLRFAQAAAAIHPEVLVEREADGSFEVRLDSRCWPSARIDPATEQLARAHGPRSELGRYLRPKLEAARSIANALVQRQRTLARVAACVFARQSRFLSEGTAAIRPLSMQEVAGELGLSLSTISRAVQGKHAQTPHGIFPLRRFFAASAGEAPDATREALVRAVREVCSAEDPAMPLSDAELLGELNRRGYKLARRTLAKLRAESGIPSSYARRTLR